MTTEPFDYSDQSPEAVRHAAATVAEGVRFLNHATMGPGGFRYPSDVDAVLVELESAAQRLPQLLGQLGGGWLAIEAAAGRLRVAGAPAAESPSAEAIAVSAIRQYLAEAAIHAEDLRGVLHDARQVTAALVPVSAREQDQAGG